METDFEQRRTISLNKSYEVRNPYFDNKKQFLAAYAKYVRRERQWRLLAIILSVYTLFSIIGISYIGAQNKLVPYIVEVNKEGKILAVRGTNQFKGENSKIVAGSILRFVENFRSVYKDLYVQQSAVYDLYSHLSDNTPAIKMINTFYKKSSPFERSKDLNIYVNVSSVLPLSGDSWEVEWIESIHSKSKKYKSGKKKYRGILKVTISPPSPKLLKNKSDKELEASLRNPLGIYVTDLTWTQQNSLL